MGMELPNKVVVDTSVIIDMCKRKVDIFDIDGLSGYDFYITRSVLLEMERLSKKNKNYEKCYIYLKKILSNFQIIEDREEYVDKSLLNLGLDYIYITNDSSLLSALKSRGKRVFRLSKLREYFEMR